MHVLVTDAASEFSLEVIRQLVSAGHQVSGLVGKPAQADQVMEQGAEALIIDPADAGELGQAIAESGAKLILNLAPQRSNNLLHDGHAWRDSEERLPGQTAALIEAAKANEISYLLHASYAFLYGPAADDGPPLVDESAPLRRPKGNKLFAAAIKAEKMAAADHGFPTCLLRIGYLYGPQSRNLALYEDSFKLRRPYYAGPQDNRVNFVHISDAAQAVVLTAEQQPEDEIINIVDGHAVSFGTFIDTYAKYLGYKKPWRIPRTLLRPVPYFITLEQIKQLDIRGPQIDNSKAKDLLGWIAEFENFEVGLAQSIAESANY